VWPGPAGGSWWLLAFALLISLFTDLRDRRIPDWVTYPAIALALALRLWSEGWGTLESGLLSGLTGAAGSAALFSVVATRKRRGLGWGDVKLLAAVGAGLGVPLALAAWLFTTVAGALQAVALLIWQRLRPGAPARERQLPYAVAIAAGTFSAMWWAYASV
jgi:prepilin peptidase CpaA